MRSPGWHQFWRHEGVMEGSWGSHSERTGGTICEDTASVTVEGPGLRGSWGEGPGQREPEALAALCCCALVPKKSSRGSSWGRGSGDVSIGRNRFKMGWPPGAAEAAERGNRSLPEKPCILWTAEPEKWSCQGALEPRGSWHGLRHQALSEVFTLLSFGFGLIWLWLCPGFPSWSKILFNLFLILKKHTVKRH